MIGAYGNTWIQTPTLDSLACQSALFDRFYASSLDLSATLAEWWQFFSPQAGLPIRDELSLLTPPPATVLSNYRTILLTDDTDVFLHEKAGLFDEKHRLESKQQSRPADKIKETQFYRNMATTADLLRYRAGTPFLLWAHFEGFARHWDFPLSYRQRYQIDEDPDPYSEVALPAIIGKNIDPDLKQSVAEAYSGGVSVLDEALSGLLAFLQKEELDRTTILLFTSARGFSLGEHHRIGSSDELYGENVHLPLFIRFPDGAFAGFRSQTLLQPADIWELLTHKNLPEEPAEIHPFLRIGNTVIVTPDWYIYQKPSGDELYVKPDDRWEINNVANRCPQVLEQMTDGSLFSKKSQVCFSDF